MTPREGRLIECIRSLILLGENEGPTIAEKCRERLGEHYVAALLELADDFVAELATKQLNAERRRAELEVQPGDPVRRSQNFCDS